MGKTESKAKDKKVQTSNPELVQSLIEENTGWAASIARSVARAWNMDWQLDGLDGGAYEALVFCAGRFDPSRGIPFRAYARRRIHEASTEEARKSKSWQQGVGASTPEDQEAREISARLFDLLPELRAKGLGSKENDDSAVRTSVRQILASASMLAALRELERSGAEKAYEYKKILEVIANMELVHQMILWGIYWQGHSMRQLASMWEIDELNVIREHKEILRYVFGRVSQPNRPLKKLKIRPGLRSTAQNLKRNKEVPPFDRFLSERNI